MKSYNQQVLSSDGYNETKEVFKVKLEMLIQSWKSNNPDRDMADLRDAIVESCLHENKKGTSKEHVLSAISYSIKELEGVLKPEEMAAFRDDLTERVSRMIDKGNAVESRRGFMRKMLGATLGAAIVGGAGFGVYKKIEKTREDTMYKELDTILANLEQEDAYFEVKDIEGADEVKIRVERSENGIEVIVRAIDTGVFSDSVMFTITFTFRKEGSGHVEVFGKKVDEKGKIVQVFDNAAHLSPYLDAIQ